MSNPYALQNLQNWINLNNRPFVLIENRVYKGWNELLLFKCLNCLNDEIPFMACQNYIIIMGGCPICENRQIGKYNSFGYKYPSIAKEFDLIKSYPTTPFNIFPGTPNKYFWICSSYPARVDCRTRNDGVGTGCPFCVSSIGERETFSILKNLQKIHNLKFERQYKIFECRDQLPLPFPLILLFGSMIIFIC